MEDKERRKQLRRINSSRRIYGADLETDTFHDENGVPDAKVVQWCVMDVAKQVETGTDLRKMMDYLIKRMKFDGASIVYFHNLNYDGTFIERNGLSSSPVSQK